MHCSRVDTRIYLKIRSNFAHRGKASRASFLKDAGGFACFHEAFSAETAPQPSPLGFALPYAIYPRMFEIRNMPNIVPDVYARIRRALPIVARVSRSISRASDFRLRLAVMKREIVIAVTRGFAFQRESRTRNAEVFKYCKIGECEASEG